MATATWTPATDGNTSSWTKNKTRTDLQADATLYDSSTVTYDDSSIYYNGYNSTTTTEEGESPALWTREAE